MKTIVPSLLLAALVGCTPDATPPPAPLRPQSPAAVAQAEATAVSAAEPIRILAWNVESGGADPLTVAMRLRLELYDIYALSEVDPDDFHVFRRSCGDRYESVISATGYDDRLQIIFNSERFELDGQQEMDRYRDFEMNNGNHRSPLMVRLRERNTGKVFQVVVNHLARGKEEVRNKQAIGLREWARDQTLPTITIGDFNLDYDFHTKRGNQAYIEIQRDDVWQWVKPAEMIDTNWSDPDGDGKDNFPDSMLDFAFVAGPAKGWNPKCRVIVQENDFPDGPKKSDHRPIELVLNP